MALTCVAPYRHPVHTLHAGAGAADKWHHATTAAGKTGACRLCAGWCRVMLQSCCRGHSLPLCHQPAAIRPHWHSLACCPIRGTAITPAAPGLHEWGHGSTCWVSCCIIGPATSRRPPPKLPTEPPCCHPASAPGDTSGDTDPGPLLQAQNPAAAQAPPNVGSRHATVHTHTPCNTSQPADGTCPAH